MVNFANSCQPQQPHQTQQASTPSLRPKFTRMSFSRPFAICAAAAAIDTVLEIGSSSGEGSTAAWVEGLRLNPRGPKLFCMEVSRVRCEALKNRWGPEGFVECFQGSSVDPDQFPSPAEVEEFHRHVAGPLQKYPLEEVLKWLQTDLDYIRQEGVPDRTASARSNERAALKTLGRC